MSTRLTILETNPLPNPRCISCTRQRRLQRPSPPIINLSFDRQSNSHCSNARQSNGRMPLASKAGGFRFRQTQIALRSRSGPAGWRHGIARQLTSGRRSSDHLQNAVVEVVKQPRYHGIAGPGPPPAPRWRSKTRPSHRRRSTVPARRLSESLSPARRRPLARSHRLTTGPLASS